MKDTLFDGKRIDSCDLRGFIIIRFKHQCSISHRAFKSLGKRYNFACCGSIKHVHERICKACYLLTKDLPSQFQSLRNQSSHFPRTLVNQISEVMNTACSFVDSRRAQKPSGIKPGLRHITELRINHLTLRHDTTYSSPQSTTE